MGTVQHATLQAKEASLATNEEATGSSRPTDFALFQNQPNPFGERTAIRIALPRASAVRLEIFDVKVSENDDGRRSHRSAARVGRCRAAIAASPPARRCGR
jgi:hypothetical protein